MFGLQIIYTTEPANAHIIRYVLILNITHLTI